MSTFNLKVRRLIAQSVQSCFLKSFLIAALLCLSFAAKGNCAFKGGGGGDAPRDSSSTQQTSKEDPGVGITYEEDVNRGKPTAQDSVRGRFGLGGVDSCQGEIQRPLHAPQVRKAFRKTIWIRIAVAAVAAVAIHLVTNGRDSVQP